MTRPNTIRRNMTLLVAAAAATFGMAPASAGTFASAILDINNFRILKSGGAQYQNADFIKLVGVNDAHATASLNNTLVSKSAIGPRPDVAHQCVGTPCPAFGENNFTPFHAVKPMLGNFGYADQNFIGSAILVNGAATGARSQTRADVATSQNMQFANSNSSVGSSNTMLFRLNSNDTMTFSFDATAFAMAYASPEGRPVTTANARISWSVNIVDLKTNALVFHYAPQEINGMATVSRTHGNNGTSLYTLPEGTKHLQETSQKLLADRDYQITVQHNTLVSALQQEVPEPASLALLGTGMVAMAIGRRLPRRPRPRT
ncbi:PEP-CTERM sorting domain-containing protein [Pseudoduganella albidiflava]|uniref:PEP-CTERM sorting domain-containing protein n=2 Tax=Pseudoduganella albidiflava TaxID=321983 RepID=A0ABX5RT10_9BURK|nr:PEP-CTERM sorting domain-containing protein [Pseudoduganella albidiflava]QBI00968.1 PEP-CTERM sorting domain-containing protein [Pseudoduganella albidiflava]